MDLNIHKSIFFKGLRFTYFFLTFWIHSRFVESNNISVYQLVDLSTKNASLDSD